jgi:hypothetical protein
MGGEIAIEKCGKGDFGVDAVSWDRRRDEPVPN